MDLGTGDGRFVLDLAKREPETFVIGIDANKKPLEKPSVKITRKPAKGGLANVMFIQAAAEDLPDELYGIADRVTINLPWGSLLRAVLLPDAEVLRGIRGLIKRGGILEVVTAIDPVRDRQELERLGLPRLTDRHFEFDLPRAYRNAGFEPNDGANPVPADRLKVRTSWGKRLSGSSERSVLRFVFTADQANP